MKENNQSQQFLDQHLRKQVNTNLGYDSIRVTLLDEAIKLLIHNQYSANYYEALYTFDQFSEQVKANFQTVQEIYEEIQNIIKEKDNPKSDEVVDRLQIDEKGNFIFKYGVFKKNKVQFRPEIMMTTSVQRSSEGEKEEKDKNSLTIQQLKKANTKLEKTLKKVLTRLQKLQSIIGVQQNLAQKIDQKQKKVIIQANEINQKIRQNLFKFKLLDNQNIRCRIQNEQGSQFQTIIKKQSIPQQISVLFPKVMDIYNQIVQIFNKQKKSVFGNRITVDKNFDLVLLIETQVDGTKVIKRGNFKTNPIYQNRLEQIEKTIKQNTKTQKQFILSIEQSLVNKIEKVHKDQERLKTQLLIIKNKKQPLIQDNPKSVQNLNVSVRNRRPRRQERQVKQPTRWIKIQQIGPGDQQLRIMAQVVSMEIIQIRRRKMVRCVIGDETGVVNAFLSPAQFIKVGASIVLFQAMADVHKQHISITVSRSGRVQQSRRKVNIVNMNVNISQKQWVQQEQHQDNKQFDIKHQGNKREDNILQGKNRGQDRRQGNNTGYDRRQGNNTGHDRRQGNNRGYDRRQGNNRGQGRQTNNRGQDRRQGNRGQGSRRQDNRRQDNIYQGNRRQDNRRQNNRRPADNRR